MCSCEDIKKTWASVQVVHISGRRKPCIEQLHRMPTPEVITPYPIPFRVRNIYTRAQTFAWQYLQCNSNFLRLRCEDNVCKRLYVSRPLLCRLRLADGDDTTYVRRRHAVTAHQPAAKLRYFCDIITFPRAFFVLRQRKSGRIIIYLSMFSPIDRIDNIRALMA